MRQKTGQAARRMVAEIQAPPFLAAVPFVHQPHGVAGAFQGCPCSPAASAVAQGDHRGRRPNKARQLAQFDQA